MIEVLVSLLHFSFYVAFILILVAFWGVLLTATVRFTLWLVRLVLDKG